MKADQALESLLPVNGYLQKGISPAEKALERGKMLYPSGLLADIYLVNADLANLRLSLDRLYFPARDVSGAYQKIRDRYQEAISREEARGLESRPDVVASGWLGIGTAFREEAGMTASRETSNTLSEQAASAFGNALSVDPQHRELTLTAVIGRAQSILEMHVERSISNETANELERLLLDAADGYEGMRASQGSGSLLQGAAFFSSRTVAYETLLLLYEKMGSPENMFKAVERMKARSFGDLLLESGEKGAVYSFNVQELSERLKEQNAGLVEFFYGPENVWIFWLSGKGGVKVRRLSMNGQELTQKISQVQLGFSGQMVLRLHLRRMRRGTVYPAMAEAYAVAAELYRELLEPVEGWLESNGLDLLYIVPHHAMHYLPFQALVVELNKENLFQSEFYIQKERALAYLPSAGTLLDICDELPKGDALVFARSDFTRQKPLYATDLPNAVPEAIMVAEILKVTPFLDGDATEEALRMNLGVHSVLYFATHGDLNSQSPLDSALLLAQTEECRKPDCDGFLTVREILGDLHGNLKAELTVMSACDTNRGEPNPLSGDDISNLSRAFLVAGSRSVLATQWVASDNSFPVIMSLFLELLTETDGSQRGKAQALSKAMQMFLDKSDIEIYRHPLFWAPVVLLGDGYSGIYPDAK